MPISSDKKVKIEKLLNTTLEKKLRKYSRETSSMPFLLRLIQDGSKVAAYSFIHSIATSLGMSIYEEVSVILAEGNCDECFRNYDLGGVISTDQKSVIDNIIRELRNGNREPDFRREMEEVLSAPTTNAKPQKDGKLADFYMKRDSVEHFFEIKTVKPNIDVFTKSKLKLLEWVARRRSRIRAVLAFPYNPYYPKPYERFTQQNLMDRGIDFLVGEEYWNFVAGENTFVELLEIFDKCGKRWKYEISRKIEQVAKEKMEGY